MSRDEAEGWQGQSPAALDWPRVRDALRGGHIGGAGAAFIYLDNTPSTNTYARELAGQKLPGGSVVVADDQTAGRGRLGRGWSVPPRTGLTFSVAFRPPTADGAFGNGLIMAAALALYDLIHDDLGLSPQLKWPNDLLLAGRKVSGILVEASGAVGGGDSLYIVGIGVNVNAAPPALEQRATCLAAALGRPLDRAAVLIALLRRLDATRAHLQRQPSAVWQRWRSTLSTLDQDVRVGLPGGGGVSGRAEDVAPSGALLVRDAAGHLHTLHAGDITLSPPG